MRIVSEQSNGRVGACVPVCASVRVFVSVCVLFVAWRVVKALKIAKKREPQTVVQLAKRHDMHT